MLSKEANRERLQVIRDMCRARGICTYCYKNPVLVQVRKGFTRHYSKCKYCLRRNAQFQAEYREKLKEKRNESLHSSNLRRQDSSIL